MLPVWWLFICFVDMSSFLALPLRAQLLPATIARFRLFHPETRGGKLENRCAIRKSLACDLTCFSAQQAIAILVDWNITVVSLNLCLLLHPKLIPLLQMFRNQCPYYGNAGSLFEIVWATWGNSATCWSNPIGYDSVPKRIYGNWLLLMGHYNLVCQRNSNSSHKSTCCYYVWNVILQHTHPPITYTVQPFLDYFVNHQNSNWFEIGVRRGLHKAAISACALTCSQSTATYRKWNKGLYWKHGRLCFQAWVGLKK